MLSLEACEVDVSMVIPCGLLTDRSEDRDRWEFGQRSRVYP